MSALVENIGGWLLALFLLAAPTATNTANEATPDAIVQIVVQDVIHEISNNHDIRSGNREKIIALVEKKVIPHFNFTTMTMLAMGPIWSKATPEQRNRLIKEFRTLFVHTYSNVLASYRGEVITIAPLRMRPSDTDVVVRALIQRSSQASIPIDLSMEKTPDGWKVYDIKVEGVSLVLNYRASFIEEVRRSGIEGLIAALAKKNQALKEEKSKNR